MSTSALKKIKKQSKKNEFSNLKKRLNALLIQNDKILVIFKYLQAKWQQFREYRVLLRIALVSILRTFLAVVQIKKTRFFAFSNIRCCKSSNKGFIQGDN